MRNLFVFVLACALAPAALARTRAIRHPGADWKPPACTQISGLPNTRAIVRVDDPFPAVRSVDDVARPNLLAMTPSVAPNVLFAAVADGTIRRSTDAGCTWSVFASVPEVLADQPAAKIVARHGSTVYVHTDQQLIRLASATVQTFALPFRPVVLDVDPADPLHLRAFTLATSTFDSRDGGATWTFHGSVMFSGSATAAAIDPNDFDHLLAGIVGLLYESRNGGVTWTATRLDLEYIFVIAFSPVDSRVSWVDGRGGGPGTSALFRIDAAEGIIYNVHDTTRCGLRAFRALAPHPQDSSLVAITCNGIRLIGPGGEVKSWPYDPTSLNAVYSPAGTLYYNNSIPRTL